MTSREPDPLFDQRISDWLEADPDHAPGPALETVLAAFPSIPQRRSSWPSWRFPAMPRPILAGAAVTAVVIGAVGLAVGLSNQAAHVGPSVGPSAIPSSGPTTPPAASGPPSSAPTLTSTFTSPRYGYTLSVDPSWTTIPATVSIDDPASTDETALDRIVIAGTDTTIEGAATALGRQTYEAWLAGHARDIAAAVPSGCTGGDPKDWPTLPVGAHQGRMAVLCNFVEVDVPVGDRVYMFTWGHESFDSARHLDRARFEDVLRTAVFSPIEAGPSAAVLPTFGPPVAEAAVPGANRWIDSDDRSIWVPQPDAGTVMRVDAATGAEVATVAVGQPGDTESLVVGPDGVWVTRLVAEGVSRIEPGEGLDASDRVVETIDTPGFRPYALALDGDRLWMTDFDAGEIAVLDLATHRLERVEGVQGGGTTGIAVGDGIVWVSANGTRELLRIDAATRRPIGEDALPGKPMSIVFGFGAAWVGTDDGSVYRAQPGTAGVTEIPIGGQVTNGLAVGSDGIYATSGPRLLSCITRPDLSFLSRIDPTTRTEVTRQEVGCAWAATVADGDVWVLRSDPDQVLRRFSIP